MRFADLVTRFEPPGRASGATAVDPGTTYTVSGFARSPALPGIGGLTVRLADKNIGGDQVLAATRTNPDGSYAISVTIGASYLAQHHKTHPDLQVRVYPASNAAGDDAALAASAVRYSAPPAISLDVVLPASAPGLPSEYETLTAQLAAIFPGSLGALEENATRQDITYLANKTGWDARAVALGALADQLSRLTAAKPGSGPDAGCGAAAAPGVLLRAAPGRAVRRSGQPVPHQPGRCPGHLAERRRRRDHPARARRRDPRRDGGLPEPERGPLSRRAAACRPVHPAPDADRHAPRSSAAGRVRPAVRLAPRRLGQLLASGGAGAGSGPASQLKLTGQLYYLTVNNQPLVTTLLGTSNHGTSNHGAITSAADLASGGYYDPAAWAPLIGDAIPAGIPGADAGERAGNYARLLAAQVRAAYPTGVLAEQVRRGIMPVTGTPDLAAGVADFLTASDGQFQVAVEAVEAYLARTGQAAAPAIVTQVKRLQRAYQLTPDDASMAVLLSHDLDSAFAITRYDPAGFARAFGDQLGGAPAATAIHARARQIFASVLSVAIGYLGGRTAPDLGGQAPVHYGFPPPQQPQQPQGSQPANQPGDLPPAYPVTAYATLENLFGSLDYCGCSDCGSILSPAAYLVDLLNYLDKPAPAAGLNPQDVLLQRRPDLQYLPLTCENTNTAVPYIDVVNETLEYFVAGGMSLAGYQGHDTGDEVTSADLIASPQYVNDAAYEVLREAFFPAPLPFNRPLALLRLHLQRLGVDLPDAMAALRADDAIVNDATPTSFGWSDILIERLAISRDEHRLFTDPALGLGSLYGLPDATALAALQQMSVRDLTRRLQISYDELAAVVATQFVNPAAWLIPRLTRLGAPFATLQVLHDNLGTPASIEADFIGALPAGLDATEYGGATPADYQAVVSWVTGPAIYPLVMGIITISDPGGADDCSGAGLQLRYSLPDDAKNLLTATDLVKLIRFIRLWRKLTPLLADADSPVTIGQTDAILAALYPAADLPAGTSDPASDPANRTLLDEGFGVLLLRLGFLFQVMGQLGLTADAALGPLLACWAPIGTAGSGSLYTRLFLSPAVLAQDPGAQTATVVGPVNTGDVLHTVINGTPVGPYTVLAADTAASAAAAIAADLNATTAPDPVSGLPLNDRFFAASSGGTVTIRAGFTLACSLSAGATEGYTAAAGSPVSGGATVTGPVSQGDTLKTTINGVPIGYQVAAGDTPATIAAGIAAAINAATAGDPYSGLPLNSLVAAISSGPEVTVTAVNAGAPFALTCSPDPANAGTYVAGRALPPFAPGGDGDILADPSQTLLGHQSSLCAAANLTGTEFALIANALGFTPGTPLTLDNVSALFRYGWLAHALGLSVLEFLLLRDFTGLDPFAPLDPGQAPPAEPPVIAFTRLLTAMAEAGLDTNAALYLIWNQDISGTSAPPAAAIGALAIALRADFESVDAAFALRDDPDGSIAKGLMTLVYGGTASDLFFGLLNNTFATSVPYSAPPGQATLPPSVVAASAGRLSYDDLRKQLSFGGVLDPPGVTAIDNAITAGAGDPALTAAVASLAAANQQSVAPFFASYPELQPLYNAYVASADPVQVRRTALLSGFLPALQRKRKQEQALAAVASAAGTDPGFAAALLADPAILHADADPAAAAVADLIAIEDQGLSARFFLGNDVTAVPDQVADTVPSLSYTQTAAVGGQVTAGDALQTVINGVAIPYQVSAADTTTALLAGSVAAAINAATAQDPASMLPLNQIVSAAASAAVITITGRDPSGAGGYFSLAASAGAGATETYVAASQLPGGQGAGPIAAIWSGYLAVPQDGDYDINVAADPGASIVLRVGGAAVPGAQAGSLWSNQGPVALTAGALVPITLTATSIRTTLSVSWRTTGVGWQPIDGQCLYAGNLVSRLGSTHTRFLKATSLASDLSLTSAEIAYLATAASVQPGWLNLLATLGNPDPATAATLAAVLPELLGFARIKRALSPADERLLAVIQNPAATLPGQPPAQTALLSLTGWTEDSVNALLTQFFGGTDPGNLSSVPNFRRIYDAQSIVRATRLSAAVLISAITNAPSPATVSALESALRARYAPSDWLAVAGPVNDAARIAQRDALVACILVRLGDSYAQSVINATTGAGAPTGAVSVTFTSTAGVTAGMLVQGSAIAPGTTVTAVAGDAVTLSNPTLAAIATGTSLTVAPDSVAFDTPDSLYEYFLIDPQTQPPVRTSRIRLALSAVQLFIERAVRNLEPQVAPADIDLQQWTWMKRYRVWQANREVFLWPENWAYPELRDNQSPLFTQMMSSLLQGDITDDAAAGAYLDYLTSLELVAKLEPCGLYYLPATGDADEVSYVVARTAGAHRKYYFRMLDAGSWTPWTEVTIECEDLPVTPVVWNSRLFLFWLKVLKQGQQAQADVSSSGSGVKDEAIASFDPSDLQKYSGVLASAAGSGSVAVQAVLCWTEFYNGKWQPTKTSDVSQPTTVGNFDPGGPGSFEACRGQVRIVPAQFTRENANAGFLSPSFQLPGDALILAITVSSDRYGPAGFVLHNTHSLPVRFEDITLTDLGKPFGPDGPPPTSIGSVLDWPAPYRSFPKSQPYTGGYGPGTFTIGYAPSLADKTEYSSDILQYNWKPRWTAPQPGLPDAWDAPFIYEDRRQQFYVTTTEHLVPAWKYEGFGMQASPGLQEKAGQAGPLTLREPVQVPIPEEITAYSAAGGDPAAVRRFLAAGQNINAAMPSDLTITYQGRAISPIGSVPAAERPAEPDGDAGVGGRGA